MVNIKCIKEFSGHDYRVWSVAWSADGKYLASCSSDKSIYVYAQRKNTETNELEWAPKVHIQEAHMKAIRHIAWSPIGNIIAAASFDGATSIWEPNDDYSDFDCLSTLPGHENEVKGVAWDPTGTLLATCGRDRTVWIWSFLPTNDGQDREFSCVSVLRGHTQDVKNVVFHPYEQLLASCSFDNTIILWTPKTEGDEWEAAKVLESHNSTVWDVCFADNGRVLISCGEDRRVCFWRRREGTNASANEWEVYAETQLHPRPVFALAAHGTHLITACGDDAIRVFDIVSTNDHPSPTASPLCPCVQPASACGPLPPLGVFCAHRGDVNGVAFRPDGTHFASCGDDNVVRIWRFDADVEM